MLEKLATILPRLKTKLQVTGLVILVAGFVAVRVAAPQEIHAQISAGAIGVLFLIFGQIFGAIDKIPEVQRANLLLTTFLLFAVFVLALIALTGVFLLRGDPADTGDLPHRLYFGTTYDESEERPYPDCRVTRTHLRLIDQNIRWLANFRPMPEGITLIAHVDRLGSDEYNLAMGQRCASVVVGAYVQRGLSRRAVFAISHGEEDASPLFVRGDARPLNYNTFVEMQLVYRDKTSCERAAPGSWYEAGNATILQCPLLSPTTLVSPSVRSNER